MQDKQEQRRETESRLEVRVPASLIVELRSIGSRNERNLSAETRWALTQHCRRERETTGAGNAAV